MAEQKYYIRELCAEILRHLDNSLWLIERTDSHQYRTGEIMPKCCPPTHMASEKIAFYRFGDDEIVLTDIEAVQDAARRIAGGWIEDIRQETAIGKSNRRFGHPNGIIVVEDGGWCVASQWDSRGLYMLSFPYSIERDPKAGIF